MEANQCNAPSHRINLSKLTHYDETKKMARNPQTEHQMELWWAQTKTAIRH